MSYHLQDKSVLITGGGSGIGRAAALACAAAGARLLVTDLNGAAAEGTAAQIREQDGEAHAMQVDVRAADQVEAMVDAAVAAYGRLDGAFNNAGVSGPMPRQLIDYDETEWDLIMDVNLKGMWLCMRAEIRQMLRQGGGRIVNTSSIVGLVGSRLLGLYAASKHGVLGLTRSAALQYGNAGIRVNAICPGWVDTPILQQAATVAPTLLDTINATSPVGRMAQPAEMGGTVVWLLSDAAAYVNGAPIPVDGGWTAQ